MVTACCAGRRLRRGVEKNGVVSAVLVRTSTQKNPIDRTRTVRTNSTRMPEFYEFSARVVAKLEN